MATAAKAQAGMWRTVIARRSAPLVDTLAGLQASLGPGRLVVVVRGADVATRIRRRLATPNQVHTLAEFLGVAGPHDIQPEDLLPSAVIHQLLADGLPPTYKGLRREHLAAEARRAVHLLEANGLRPPYQKPATRDTDIALEAAHRALLSGLQTHNEAGRFADFQRVSEAQRGTPRFHARFPLCTDVALFGLEWLSPAERNALDAVLADLRVHALFRARDTTTRDPDSGHPALQHADAVVDWLGRHGPTEDLGTGADDKRTARLHTLFAELPAQKTELPDVHIETARDRNDEVDRAALRAATHIAAGTPPHEIAIIVPELARVSALLADRLREHGVPAAQSHRGHTRSTPPGTLLSLILATLESDLERDDVLDLLAHPLVLANAPDGTRPWPEAVGRWLLEHGLRPRGRAAWDDAFVRMAQPWPGDDAHRRPPPAWLPAQHAAFAAALDRLDALRRAPDADAFFDALRGMLEAWHVPRKAAALARDASDPALLLAAYRQVLSILDETEDALQLAPPRHGGNGPAREALDRALRAAEIPLAADPDHGVQVLGLRNARHRSFRHAFVLGLTRDALAPRSHDERLLRALGRRHGDLEAIDSAAEARHILHGILADTQGTVILSHPENDEGTQTPRSVILDEIEDAFTLHPAPAPPQELRTARALHRAAVRTGRPLAAPPEVLAAATQLVMARNSAGPAGPYTGRIADPRVLALTGPRPLEPGKPLAPSRLDRYARCPFRSLVEDGLHLRRPPQREAGLQPADRGAFLHRVLERYTQDALDRNGTPFRPTESTVDGERGRLFATAVDLLVEYRLDDPAHEAFHEELFGGLALGGNRWARAPPGLLARFLDDLLHLAPGEGILRSEAGFGGEGEPRVELVTPDGNVALVGRIDRVDRVQASDAAAAGVRILDYKSGRVPPRDRIEGGIDFQLPLYAHAARVIEPGSTVHAVGYYQLRRARKDGFGASRAQSLVRADGPEAFDRLLDHDTPRRVGALVTAARAGHFALTLLDEKTAGCSHCDVRRACGLRPSIQPGRRAAALLTRDQPPSQVGYVPDRLAPDEEDDA